MKINLEINIKIIIRIDELPLAFDYGTILRMILQPHAVSYQLSP